MSERFESMQNEGDEKLSHKAAWRYLGVRYGDGFALVPDGKWENPYSNPPGKVTNYYLRSSLDRLRPQAEEIRRIKTMAAIEAERVEAEAERVEAENVAQQRKLLDSFGEQQGHIWDIYCGSNSGATRSLHARLERLGADGMIVATLLRIAKSSERAKVYRGRGYREKAYARKDANIAPLVELLARSTLRWGWGIDDALQARGDPHYHVLYVELPSGQVSFHLAQRSDGPDYPAAWDGIPGISALRIAHWAGTILERAAPR